MTTNFFAPAFRWVCKWRGHRFGKPYQAMDSRDVPVGYTNSRVKICKRCSLVREVKTRARKA